MSSVKHEKQKIPFSRSGLA